MAHPTQNQTRGVTPPIDPRLHMTNVTTMNPVSEKRLKQTSLKENTVDFDLHQDKLTSSTQIQITTRGKINSITRHAMQILRRG